MESQVTLTLATFEHQVPPTMMPKPGGEEGQMNRQDHVACGGGGEEELAGACSVGGKEEQLRHPVRDWGGGGEPLGGPGYEGSKVELKTVQIVAKNVKKKMSWLKLGPNN